MWYAPDYRKADDVCGGWNTRETFSNKSLRGHIVAFMYSGSLTDELVWFTVNQPFPGTLRGIGLNSDVAALERRYPERLRPDRVPARLLTDDWAIGWSETEGRVASLTPYDSRYGVVPGVR